ncbi:MAG: RIP metalloprotease RseP [Proteobacteria bacterium]|nr:RIP metalloprotease RseP [Pseudomonadota bacterium]
MITLFAFVGAIALLVVFHEYGHYWMARRCGVKVLVFSLGFGKVIYRKRFAGSDTEWVISMVPLGGYVKMLDEREGEVLPCEFNLTFNRKPVLQRMAIVAAGPLANFLLAVVLYWVLFIHGVPGLKPVLGEVQSGTPAATAQMHQGETIISINGEAIPGWQELRWELLMLAIKQGDARIEAQTVSGTTVYHSLDLSGLQARDLDGEFLDKLGLHLDQPTFLPVIGKLTTAGVGELAGLREGDLILRAQGLPVSSWSMLVDRVRSHPGKPLSLDIKRGELTLNIVVIPQAVIESDPKSSGPGTQKMVGKIGAAPKVDQAAVQAMFTEVRYGPLDALIQSLKKTIDTAVISLKMLAKMVMGEVSMKNLSGPITIADYAGQSAHMGLAAYLGFLALISISLGVLNLLPVPLLDGGHLLYYVAEMLKGSPVSDRAWEIGQKIGIALLGTLMVCAIYNDINRLISG